VEILELLQAEKIEEFNEKRSYRSSPDLFAVELAGKDLSGADLSGVNLDKSDLTETILADTNLMNARMNGIDGTKMSFYSALGIKIKLRDAWLEGANLNSADFSRGNLTEAYLRDAHGDLIRMSATILKDVDAVGVKWPEADLSEAVLTRADFTTADLSRADLTSVSANGSTFADARLDGVMGSGIRLAGANLKGASLMGARLSGANLTDADLTGAHLGGADLSGANLTGANLEGANLQGAVLADASLDGIDFTTVNLEDTDLTGVDPNALGLTDEQKAGLASYGAGVAAFEETRVSKLHSAANGEYVAGVWINDHDEELQSIRWVLFGPDKEVHNGVLPVAASGVVAHDIIAVGEGFDLLLLHDRTTGALASRYRLAPSGVISPSGTSPLGYEPVVTPILRGGDSLEVIGLAKRGPTVVVSGVGEEGLVPLASERVATGQGFLSRHDPIIMSKGGVLIPLDGRRVAKPLRTPDPFPGGFAVAALGEEGQCIAAWVRQPKAKDKGGIEYAWLGARGPGEVVRLSVGDEVECLDLVARGERAWLCWIQDEKIHVGDTDKLEPTILKSAHTPLELQLIQGAKEPILAVVTAQQGIVLMDLRGRVRVKYQGD
jgi:uncharacterized protein YjbI with pentapeptide repeats